MSPASIAEPIKVGSREFRNKMSDYLAKAASGVTILIMQHNVIVAELGPPPKPEKPKRLFGVLKGKIEIADDFDKTPDDLIDAMEGGDL